METEPKLKTVRGIKRIPECATLSRDFVDYLRNLGVVKGTRVPIIKRFIWKYTSEEAALIQSVWHFRKKEFELSKSIQLAQKSLERRDFQKMEMNLFSDWGS
jgi:hypothetical protein